MEITGIEKTSPPVHGEGLFSQGSFGLMGIHLAYLSYFLFDGLSSFQKEKKAPIQGAFFVPRPTITDLREQRIYAGVNVCARLFLIFAWCIDRKWCTFPQKGYRLFQMVGHFGDIVYSLVEMTRRWGECGEIIVYLCSSRVKHLLTVKERENLYRLFWEKFFLAGFYSANLFLSSLEMASLIFSIAFPGGGVLILASIVSLLVHVIFHFSNHGDQEVDRMRSLEIYPYKKFHLV